MDQCKLIIDKGREHQITRHKHQFEGINFIEQQITTGDYNIIGPTGKLLMVIERKTLSDYGSSIRDGRHENKSKLLAARAETNCRIVYIIEGPEYPKPEETYGGIPYKTIESSVMHLAIRDGIFHFRTKDTIHTATKLVEIVSYLNKLVSTDALEQPNDTSLTASQLTGGNDCTSETMALLTKKHVKSLHDIAREMWACFRGISTESADDYIHKWSLMDIVLGAVSRADITNFKMSSGRKINTRVIGSLTGINKPIESKLLSTIPGISAITATAITSKWTLPQFLSLPQAQMAEFPIGKMGRPLGLKVTGEIIKCFSYSLKPHSADLSTALGSSPITSSSASIS
jgi:ERCC4-type nuclease